MNLAGRALELDLNEIESIVFGLEQIFVVHLLAMAVMGKVMSLGMLCAFMSYKNQFVGRIDGLIDMLIKFKMIGLHLYRLADIVFTDAEDVTYSYSAMPA